MKAETDANMSAVNKSFFTRIDGLKGDTSIIRDGYRNYSVRFTSEEGDFFIKQGISSSSDPSDEYMVWRFLKKYARAYVPAFLAADSTSKRIVYRWIRDAEEADWLRDSVALKDVAAFMTLTGKADLASVRTDRKLEQILLAHRNSQKEKYEKSFREFFMDCPVDLPDIFSVKEFLALWSRIFEGYSFVHGDMSESNFVLVPDGRLFVLDYEFSMIACQEYDVGRIAASILLKTEQPFPWEEPVYLGWLKESAFLCTNGINMNMVVLGQLIFRWMLYSDRQKAVKRERFCLLLDYFFSSGQKDSIQILVATRKELVKEILLPQSRIYRTIYVGASGQAHPSGLYDYFDDDGEDTLSAKNDLYSELTAQYWAWKNLDLEYYGFCHYRRFFIFAPDRQLDDGYGNCFCTAWNEKVWDYLQVRDKHILEALNGCDGIMTELSDIRSDQKYETVLDQYGGGRYRFAKDLLTAGDVIEELFPAYRPYFDRVIQGHYTCFCNMYILKKRLFEEYCSFLFPVLKEVERRTDFTAYSKESRRFLGHISERLFTVFYLYQKDSHKYTWKKYQRVWVDYMEKPVIIDHKSFEKNSVPVIMVCNDNYKTLLAACIRSLVDNSSRDYNYDLIIMHDDISGVDQKIIKEMAVQENVSVSFVDISYHVNHAGFKPYGHLAKQTFYRLLIPEIVRAYDKVIYLDVDTIVLHDMADLYVHWDLNNCLLGAVKDISIQGKANRKDSDKKDYILNYLKMEKVGDYFQAGVLLMNLKALREDFPLDERIMLSRTDHKYCDQDVLNIKCEGRILYLPLCWNVYQMHRDVNFAPKDLQDQYFLAHEDPYVIHYAGSIKAFSEADADFSTIFWQYARKTPYYEQMLIRLMEAAVSKEKGKHV